MKTRLCITCMLWLSMSARATEQSLETDLLNPQQEIVSSCNCNEVGAGKTYRLRVSLPSGAEQYDKIEVRYYDTGDGKRIHTDYLSGKKFRADYGHLGYYETQINQVGTAVVCSRPDDYALQLEVVGYMQTGTRTYEKNGVEYTEATYGEARHFGKSDGVWIRTDQEMHRQYSTRKFFTTCASVVLGTLYILAEIISEE